MKEPLQQNADTQTKQEQLSKEEVIRLICSMREKHNACLSELVSPGKDYRAVIDSLQSLVNQANSENSALTTVKEVKSLLEKLLQELLEKHQSNQQAQAFQAARLASIMENADVCIGQLDEQGLLIDFNHHFAQLFQQLCSCTILKGVDFVAALQHASLGRLCRESLNYCLLGQNRQSSEIITLNNKSTILNLRFYPIWQQEEVKGVSVFVENLTQKHQQESLFRLLNSAVVYTNDAILITEVSRDPIKKYPAIYANRAYCTLSGYTEAEIIGNEPAMMQESPDRPEHTAQLKALIQAGQSGRIDLLSYRKDGSEYWASISLEPLKDKQGKITHWITIQRDISESKRAARTIQEQKHFLESVNRNTSEAILCADGQRKLRFVNRAFEKLFQYKRDEITLNKLFANIPSRQSFETMLREEGCISNKSFLFRRKDGTTFWGLTSFSVNEYQGALQIDGAIRDISHIKETEKILQEKNQALKKANEELDRFVYSASHDLRAPLASTLGLINVTRISQDEEDKLQYLDMMEQSLNKMDKTIQDITDYSRNARLQIESEEIHFESILDDVLQRLKYLKHVDDVKINIHIEGEETFYTDKMRLYVILINLISNAIKYLRYDESDPYIDIRIQVDKQTARILVEDNGIGIDEAHLDKIFGMFFQAARESSGSGLGLFIVKESINKLKGSIRVRSELKKGSCFEIILPNESQNVKT